MPATMTFNCPECDAQLTGPANLQGKRVRCKKCGKVVVLPKAAASAKSKPVKGPAAPTPAGADEDGPNMYGWLSDDANQKMIAANQVAPLKSDLQPKYEDVSKNPYGLTKLDESSRCPHCAKEMQPGDIVCLNCGYNTQSRSHGKVVRTYATTPAEQFMWSLPGILCIAGIAALVFGIVYLWTGLSEPKDDSLWKEFVKPARVWGSIFGGFVIVGLGMFAFKRLIQNPKPPEKIKR